MVPRWPVSRRPGRCRARPPSPRGGAACCHPRPVERGSQLLKRLMEGVQSAFSPSGPSGKSLTQARTPGATCRSTEVGLEL